MVPVRFLNSANFNTWIGLSDALDDQFVQIPLISHQVVSFFYANFFNEFPMKNPFRNYRTGTPF